MGYVRRDEQGEIIGWMLGLSEPLFVEYLPDDNPEVVAFLNKPLPPLPPPPETTILYDHENRLRAIEGQPPLTLEDVIIRMRGT